MVELNPNILILPSLNTFVLQMAWEQGCPAIIALTKCVEKGRDKCHQYWPDGDISTTVYGDVEVRLLPDVIAGVGHDIRWSFR